MRKALVFAFLLPCFWHPAWGQSPRGIDASQPQPDKRIGSNESPQQRGTKQNPLVVDTLGHQQTPVEREEAEDQASEAKIGEYIHNTFEISNHNWAISAAVATWVLVFVGIGGTIAAICTLREIQKQTTATQTAANAALLNAQAVIDSERGKLIVITENQGSLCLDFRLMNIGRLVAQLFYVYAEVGLREWDAILPEVPAYLKSPDPGQIVTDWIAPNGTAELTTDGSILRVDLSNTENRARTQSKTHAMWVLGCFKYYDGIVRDPRTIRFCYRCWSEADNRPIEVESYGPDAYRGEFSPDAKTVSQKA